MERYTWLFPTFLRFVEIIIVLLLVMLIAFSSMERSDSAQAALA